MRVQHGMHAQACFGGGMTHEFQHEFVADQRLATPVDRDEREELVLDGIPLGSSGRIMADVHGQLAKCCRETFQRQHLEALLPPPSARRRVSLALGYSGWPYCSQYWRMDSTAKAAVP